MRLIKTLILGAAFAALGGAPAMAAGPGVGVIDKEWSFEGPFGTFDRPQLQRGWQVYSEVCSTCHSLSYVSFRNLGEVGGPEFPPEQVKAIAANFNNKIRFVAEAELAERDATPQDKIIGPYSVMTLSGLIETDEEEAKGANGGALPPDLSLITKARIGYHGILGQIVNGSGGPEYLYSLLLGYQDEEPEGFDTAGLNYNRYFPGHRIAMAQPLWGDDVTYQDGTEATIEQQAADVTAFLTWAAEPKMIERKQAGVRNIIFLTIFAVLLWYTNRKLWAPVKGK